MADKPKTIELDTATIKAEVTEDGKLVIIKINFKDKLRSFKQLNQILNKFFTIADFKYVEKTKQTSIH